MIEQSLSGLAGVSVFNKWKDARWQKNLATLKKQGRYSLKHFFRVFLFVFIFPRGQGQ
jgi:hypothetical protein